MKVPRLVRNAAGIVLLLLSALQLGSQSTGASVIISSLPAWGQDGSINGAVYGLLSSQVSLFIFEFIPDVGWVSVPGCGATQIQGTGQFSVNATPNLINRSATRISAYLLPSLAANSVPCVGGSPSIPFFVVSNALSVATYPRLPAYHTVSFGGLDWNVKEAPVQVSPNSQFFSGNNAFVDGLGQLHLKVTQCSGSWCAAEVFTTQTVGYGSYSFTISSPVNNIDPNLTLGLFTWDAQAADNANREWDIEFSRWGNANATSNAQYVVQPYNGPNNIQPFLMSPAAVSQHSVTWSPSQVGFSSSASGAPISSWTFTAGAAPVPTPGDVHLHLNLYIGSGASPVSPLGTEIIISNFQYTPAAQQAGLSRVSDSVPFYASSNTVPISGSAACVASVESDSPWIQITGPNPVSAGGFFGYSVMDNYGSARSGNIILTSTNCASTLGRQVLGVTQAGLVCNPTFATAGSNVGFLASAYAVIIRGTAPVCTWTVSSSAPWLQITSAASGSGDGSVTFTTDANSDATLRQGTLVLANGPQHTVYQDAGGAYLSLTPAAATPCTGSTAAFGATWISPNPNAELHFDSPGGILIGQVGASGALNLPPIPDGTLVFLTQPTVSGSTPLAMASARATVLPASCAAANVNPLGVVNAANVSSAAASIAVGSYVAVFGTNLSSTTATAQAIPYPTTLGGISVTIGGEQCGLTYVSSTQINFVAPSDLMPGRYPMVVGTATAEVNVTNAAPGIFTLNGIGTGTPLAQVVEVFTDNTSTTLAPYACSTSCQSVPITVPPNLAALYVVVYGTGFSRMHSGLATLGGIPANVVYVGAVASYPGLDQMNLQISNPYALTGTQQLMLTVDGVNANTVSITFQ